MTYTIQYFENGEWINFMTGCTKDEATMYAKAVRPVYGKVRKIAEK